MRGASVATAGRWMLSFLMYLTLSLGGFLSFCLVFVSFLMVRTPPQARSMRPLPPSRTPSLWRALATPFRCAAAPMPSPRASSSPPTGTMRMATGAWEGSSSVTPRSSTTRRTVTRSRSASMMAAHTRWSTPSPSTLIAQASAPRGVDGALPMSDLRLSAGSDRFEAGRDLGRPSTGSAPDRGAFGE